MTLHSDSPVQDVRHRLLRTAYLNAFWPIKSMALATDMALAALDAADPGAAVQLVRDMATILYGRKTLRHARARGGCRSRGRVWNTVTVRSTSSLGNTR